MRVAVLLEERCKPNSNAFAYLRSIQRCARMHSGRGIMQDSGDGMSRLLHPSQALPRWGRQDIKPEELDTDLLIPR